MTNKPERYRRIPSEFTVMLFPEDPEEAMEVFRWVSRNTDGVYNPNTCEPPESGVSIDAANGYMLIATPEGQLVVTPGTYVLTSNEGEFTLCDPFIFEKTYEKVGE